MNEQHENPFRPPSQLDAAKPVSSVVFVFACLLWCGLAVKMAVIQPVTRSFFEEFEVALPTLTLVLLHPLHSGLFMAIAACILVAGVVAKTPAQRRRVGWFGVWLAVAAIILMAIGFGLPLLSLMRALS